MIIVLLAMLTVAGMSVGVLMRNRRRCPECDYVFPTPDDMRHHLKRMHP